MADEQSASISLIGMADRPTGLEDYTTSVATLQRGVQKMFAQPGAGTVFQDSIVDAIKGIRARQNPRRALLVITTDGPDFSNVPYQRTLEMLAASGTTLHVLRISPNGGSMRDEQARDRSYVIDQGTRASGGRRQELLTSMGLADALEPGGRGSGRAVQGGLRPSGRADPAEGGRSRREASGPRPRAARWSR